jgi:hypothetical protein
MNVNFILNVVIQVSAVFIFLSVFYFTYVKNKEADTVKNQVNFLIDSFDLNLLPLPDNLKQWILEKINNIKTNTPDNQSINENIDKQNNAIKKEVILIIFKIITFITILISSSYMLSKTKMAFFNKLDLPKIMKETSVIVFFVALTEFMFLTYIASNYISVDPHLIKGEFFTNLSKF